jgi:Na+/H+ antiporter NhaD/arsenite permease-like protein
LKLQNMKIFALIVFAAVYLVMIAKPKYRLWAAAGGAVLFLLSGIVPISTIFSVIDFNVLLMIAGMMVTVSFFITSQMPMKIADFLLDHSKNLMMVTIYLSLFAGLISAFIDNVATVLMVAPVAIAISRKLKVSPVPMVISIAVSSNLQGAATLVGDATSIMLGAYAHMNFVDFFFIKGRPGIFWAVELGALCTIPVMLFLFHELKEPVEGAEETEVKDYVPTILLLGTILTLIGASFVQKKPEITNGVICCIFAVLSMIHAYLKERRLVPIRLAVRDIDFATLALLASLFVVIGGISNVGIIHDIASLFVKVGGNHVFLLYTLIVWASVGISAFIDNIPYVTAMLPVIAGVAGMMKMEPYLLYFGLLSGATLGGNLTPFGASANITGIGILRKYGYEVPNRDFMRISVPFTLAAVTAGYLLIWFVWR